jgi:hypothetical protein
MRKILMKTVFPLSIIFFVTACAQSNNNKTGSVKKQKESRESYSEGKDYFRLKRYRLVDKSGFGQAVEAASFLVPSDWTMEGGIQWQNARCLSDIIQSNLHGYSADKSFEFFMYPVTQFDWSDNPQTLQAMRNGDVGLRCTLAPPADASTYIKTTLIKLANATNASTKKAVAIETHLQQAAAVMNGNMKNNGMGYTIKPSAAEGTLQFADGSEGLALCIINQTMTTIPDYNFGEGTIHTYQTEVTARLVIKHPAGQGEKARIILSTILSSTRFNPVWANAVQTMFTNIKQNIQNESWKRIQISYEAQQEMSKNIVRGWESRNAAEGANPNSAFSEYLRGVETWKDEAGGTIELTSGYSYAWQHADGSYLLSNTHGFDPNVALQENWKPLTK